METSAHHSPEPPTDEEVALCAYRIWLQEGCPHGRDREHWLRARKQLLSARKLENAPPSAGEPVPSPSDAV